MRSLSPHTFLFVLFSLLLTVFAGIPACTKRSTQVISSQTDATARVASININTASAAELEELPHVGPVLARKIIDHRNRYGAFRRAEHLLAVEGVSEKRYRELREFIDIK
jgi:competence protein ComEA